MFLLILLLYITVNIINCYDIQLAYQYYNNGLICDANSDYTCAINLYKEGIYFFDLFDI